MKKKFTKKTYLQSVVSLAILSVFAYMALSYAGASQQKRLLSDGRWEIARNFANGKSSITTGNVNRYGAFEGRVTIRYEKDFELKSTEEVNMINGLRQGTSTVTYANGYQEYWCYEDGEAIHQGKCADKDAIIEDKDSSAYSTFANYVPWFATNLKAFGYDEVYIKSFLDTLELLLYKNNLTVENFDDYYDEAIEVLEATPYDSLINLNSELSIYNGLDLIMRHQFRLATFDGYLKGDSNTYNVIKTTYPNYLLSLNGFGVTDSDFKKFCHQYDSIMATYPPVALNDTFIVDTLDSRIYNTLNIINEAEESSPTAMLKSTNLNIASESNTSQKAEYFSFIRNYIKDNTPTEVSAVVFSTMLMQFVKGDFIRQAVSEAFSLKKGLARLPVTSIKISNLSSTSCTIVGNVINDGGAAVTERGISWATYFNPEKEGNLEPAGTGSGEFSVTLNGLTPGTTYYARSYATNSAGTYYGNCIEFSTYATGVEDLLNPAIDLLIYPNPFSAKINIEICLETVEDAELMVINMQGQVVSNKEFNGLLPGQNNFEIDLSGLDNGMYTCKVILNKKEVSRKLLKVAGD